MTVSLGLLKVIRFHGSIKCIGALLRTVLLQHNHYGLDHKVGCFKNFVATMDCSTNSGVALFLKLGFLSRSNWLVVLVGGAEKKHKLVP